MFLVLLVTFILGSWYMQITYLNSFFLMPSPPSSSLYIFHKNLIDACIQLLMVPLGPTPVF